LRRGDARNSFKLFKTLKRRTQRLTRESKLIALPNKCWQNMSLRTTL
jgi:hypothetical protein